jgi:hypothetical protein
MARISSDEWAELLNFIKTPPSKKKKKEEGRLPISLIKSYQEIKELGLEKYYYYFKQRFDVRKSQGLSFDDAEWKGMNDTVYYFIEQTKFTLDSVEVNQFIKKMVRTCR